MEASPHLEDRVGAADITDAELETFTDAQFDRHLDLRHKFDLAVERAAERIRVQEAARLKVAADALAGADFSDQYLDRGALLTLPRSEPLLTGVLPRHAYAVLRGRDHSFKSFVAVDWALCLATGKRWQGRDAEQVRVLYVAGEGAYGIAARVAAWEYAWQTDVPPDQFTIRKTALNLHRPGPAFDDLLERVTDGGYGLVVIDTLRRVSGQADANSSDMGVVVDNLDRIKQATAHGSLLVLAHTDKGDHDSRGYSGIEDDADVVWHARREDMRLTLELTKMKDGPDGTKVELAAKLALDSLVLSAGTGAPVSTVPSQITLLDTMREMFRDGAYSGQLLEASGLTKPTYYRALTALKDAGHLVNQGSHARPFLILTETPESHEVSRIDTPTDLQESHESHGVSSEVPLGLTGLTTLRSETDET